MAVFGDGASKEVFQVNQVMEVKWGPNSFGLVSCSLAGREHGGHFQLFFLGIAGLGFPGNGGRRT